MKIEVKNMKNKKTGNSVPNQYIVTAEKGTYFQSYDTTIAFIPYNPRMPRQLDIENWDYSSTTGKYRNMFLDESKKETERKIASGEYVLTSLN